MNRNKVAAFFVLLLCVDAAAAETSNELTPFGAWRFGGSFEVEEADGAYELDDAAGFGLIFNRRHSDRTQWEVFFSQQDTRAVFSEVTINDPRVDVRTTILQLGGTYLGPEGRAQPYLAATIGGTHVEADSRGSESDTYLSGSIGVGLRFAPNARVGLRLEARAHGALARSDSDLFCQTGPDQNVCALTLEGRLFGQLELFAGAVLRF